jgi:hypothetical protein
LYQPLADIYDHGITIHDVVGAGARLYPSGIDDDLRRI